MVFNPGTDKLSWLQTGWFLGALGITVLPSSALVANYISNRYHERFSLHKLIPSNVNFNE
jgi:hypothetical protein